MANRVEGVYEKIIECALSEFMQYGYTDASLRRIAAAAQTTTGTIYSRFKDKEGLFEAIVSPCYNTLLQMFESALSDFSKISPDEQTEHVGEISGDCMEKMLEFSFEHLSEVRLILCKSEGTGFSGLIDEMVRLETKATDDYIKVLRSLGTEPQIDTKLEHIIITGMFHTFFETVIHDMPFEQAKKYLRQMRRFYTAGWMEILGV